MYIKVMGMIMVPDDQSDRKSITSMGFFCSKYANWGSGPPV